MFFGGVNLLIAIMYSIWDMLSIESKTIACSFLCNVELRVVSAKDFFPKAYFSGSLLVFCCDAKLILCTLCIWLVLLVESWLEIFISVVLIASLLKSLSECWDGRGSLVALSAIIFIILFIICIIFNMIKKIIKFRITFHNIPKEFFSPNFIIFILDVI